MTRRRISELKTIARGALLGNFTAAAFSMVFIGIIAALGNSLAMGLFGGSGIFAVIMSQIFSIIVSLITSVFYAGIYYMFLNMSRGKPAGMSDIFQMFQKHPDRIIIVSLVITAVEYILMLPGQILSYQMPVNTDDISALMRDMLVMAAVLYIGMAVSVVVTMPLNLSYYLLVDHEEMGAGEAMRESMRLMKGNYGRYLYLMCSFIGMILLAVCSCYIGFLWVSPYLQMTQIEFYRDVIGELDQSEDSDEKQQDTEEGAGPDSDCTVTDDYNAEA